MDSASAQKTEIHYTMSLDIGFLLKLCQGNIYLGMDICGGAGGQNTQVLWRRQAIAFIRFSKVQ